MQVRCFLRKERLGQAIESWRRKGYEVFLPYLEGDTVLLSPHRPDREPFFESPSVVPPKSILFPQSEVLFRFRHRKEDGRRKVELQEVLESQDVLIFGSRPCDARAFLTFDKVFLSEDPKDPYYMERRGRAVICSLTCPFPTPSCFCTSVGSGPDDKEGSDILATELEEGFYLEVLSEKGRALVEDGLFEDGSPFEQEARRRAERTRRYMRVPFAQEAGIDKKAFEDDEFWKQVVSKCLSCGLCTYLCPTCYCFNITDETGFESGERIRSWDSCMFHHYTLEASGHNPRPTKFDRFKNRVGHKFLFFPERFDGMLSCTGCGRCVRFCPVSLDIADIVRRLKEEK